MKLDTIALHSGTFHADDAFAAAIIRIMNPAAKIIRSRDDVVLATADLRIDVGGRYMPSLGDFDHHMTDGAGERSNGVPYAACGLVWKHFGPTICRSRFVADHVEARIIQSIDAIDCGYTIVRDDDGGPRMYSVSDVIDSMNPKWDDENPDYDAAFERAVEIAKTILQNEIAKSLGYEKAHHLVRKAIHNAANPHYVILEKYCPWQEIIIKETDFIYVIFPEQTSPEAWRMRAVPKTMDSFVVRKLLPAKWGGKRDKELAAITGVPDATFCHQARFIAGASSLEGIKRLAEIALGYDSPESGYNQMFNAE